MKTIRNNVFETNSSSTHSLCIGVGEKEFPILDDQNNVVIHLSTYGWEIDSYYGLEDRMSYVFSYLYDSRKDYYKELYDQLIDYIKENTGANDVEFTGTDWCYVDHGSEHMTLTFQWLIDFMFNKGGNFTTDNDNH